MNRIPSTRTLKLALLLGASTALAATAAHAQTYLVTINTSTLSSAALSGDAPFGLEFQMNYGGGSAGNSATVSNFNFGGGSATPGTTFVTNSQGGAGTATGSLASQVTISDNAANPFNLFSQNFTPGSTVSFNVTLTDNGPFGQTPDGFVVALDEGPDGFEIPTTQDGASNDGVALAEFDLRAGSVTVDTYAGANNPDLGGDFSGVTVSVQAVPEPSSWLLGLGACAMFAGLRRRWLKA
jgi:PEP-CTERM motif